jgi:hypothetical protein
LGNTLEKLVPDAVQLGGHSQKSATKKNKKSAMKPLHLGGRSQKPAN